MPIDKNSIVLLDDNELTNFCNKDIIEELNCFEEILVYSEPSTLLDYISKKIKANKTIPGFFLVDIKMPEMDGFEFIGRLKEMLNYSMQLPKVFMLTTSNHKKDMERFENEDLAKKYIVKPLLPEKVEHELCL